MTTIAFLEDDNDLNILLSNYLKREGFTILSYNSGIEFIQDIKDGIIEFDLIITDVDMPLQTGIETISQLSNIYDISNIPILFLTAIADEVAMYKAHENNSNHLYYMLKPVNYSLLNMTLIKMIIARDQLASIRRTNAKLIKVVRQLQNEKEKIIEDKNMLCKDFVQRREQLINELSALQESLNKFN